ncbi:nucleoside-diphosphate sugar epimerase/dehydratase [Neptuniibacter sp. CAU 1671]|uniref:polysaccharide biosynthesis protein n=1 Tax=Neptuniibacter sp. CAU 1671 TaxID=3032593 RepID=UPI0023DB5533|nr:nucleoside-diphosphate sugar epimerase/dehydratase [Neptuniibacter sp. CAU 1671]MDF2181406.1 nucleoside-diphosphate sugar epimerase/dehydratase [Neptuniibacter sp. CAU 1671]
MTDKKGFINNFVVSTSRPAKKALMVLGDLFMLPLAIWSSYALRLSDWWPDEYLYPAVLIFLITPLVGVAAFAYFGLYRAVVRFMTLQAVYQVIKGVALASVSMYAVVLIFDLPIFPRSVPIIFAMVALVYVGGSRLLVRNYYYWLITQYIKSEPVLVYGAGSTGVQLISALKGSGSYSPVGFIDDNPRLQGNTVAGFEVFDAAGLESLIEQNRVQHILLAIPRASKERKRQILDYLGRFPVKVKTVPSLPELVSGKSLSALRDVQIEDLLGRDPVPPIQSLIEKSVSQKNVLITGAGGSIGSEIARQVARYGASHIILLDSNEYALYSIDQDIQKLLAGKTDNVAVSSLLGSVVDPVFMQRVMQRFNIDTVYHAAAYKHVPMVEHNIVNGVRNNVLGTQVVVSAAVSTGVNRFILVSTDKAVRPTNVMGATKRMAEMIVQDAARCQQSMICSMVRFGNVLGSSGSVVPLFKRQIEALGPVTVTHPEITRYFMTISEAASLVIQAGSMAEGGEVFLLDMGDAVKIVDLAERMIQLSGHSVKTSGSSEGEIELLFTGLRPGEKLYEELLIGEAEEPTEHPKILKANESLMEHDHLIGVLEEINMAVDAFDGAKAKQILMDAVKEYVATDTHVDWLDKHDQPAVAAGHPICHTK